MFHLLGTLPFSREKHILNMLISNNFVGYLLPTTEPFYYLIQV